MPGPRVRTFSSPDDVRQLLLSSIQRKAKGVAIAAGAVFLLTLALRSRMPIVPVIAAIVAVFWVRARLSRR